MKAARLLVVLAVCLGSSGAIMGLSEDYVDVQTATSSLIVPDQRQGPPTQSTPKERASEGGDTSQTIIMWSAVAQAVFAALVFAVTGGLLWVAHRQWVAMNRQAKFMSDGLAETQKSADAAKKSADVASEALRLSAQTGLDLRDVRARAIIGKGGEVDSIEIRYNLFNPTGNPAILTLQTITWDVGPNDGPFTRRQADETLISPGRGYDYAFTVGPLSHEQQRRWADDGGLGVNFHVSVIFKDPLGNSTTRLLSRTCLVGPRGVHSLLWDLSGYEPSEKG